MWACHSPSSSLPCLLPVPWRSRCYEIRCQPRIVVDAYGNSMDRTGVCMVGNDSVVVRTVDSCPCYYPAVSG